MKAADFYTSHMVPYSAKDARRISFLSIGVLPVLKGRPWDDLALAYVHSLRPSAIRVVRGAETCDAQTWRVTVYVDSDNIITEVRQECEVWCPEGVENGHDLWLQTKPHSTVPSPSDRPEPVD